MFWGLGCRIMDADILAREVVGPGAGQAGLWRKGGYSFQFGAV
jgi:hypothetical protein